MWVSDAFRQALGRHGDKAEEYMKLQYFKERVGAFNVQ